MTNYTDKVKILSQFFADYRDEPLYADYFVTYLTACHMAYLLDHELMSDLTENIVRMSIEEAFDELLDGFNIESGKFTELDQVFNASPNREVA